MQQAMEEEQAAEAVRQQQLVQQQEAAQQRRRQQQARAHAAAEEEHRRQQQVQEEAERREKQEQERRQQQQAEAARQLRQQQELERHVACLYCTMCPEELADLQSALASLEATRQRSSCRLIRYRASFAPCCVNKQPYRIRTGRNVFCSALLANHLKLILESVFVPSWSQCRHDQLTAQICAGKQKQGKSKRNSSNSCWQRLKLPRN